MITEKFIVSEDENINNSLLVASPDCKSNLDSFLSFCLNFCVLGSMD